MMLRILLEAISILLDRTSGSLLENLEGDLAILEINFTQDLIMDLLTCKLINQASSKI